MSDEPASNGSTERD